jgi:hypothetical protein
MKIIFLMVSCAFAIAASAEGTKKPPRPSLGAVGLFKANREDPLLVQARVALPLIEYASCQANFLNLFSHCKPAAVGHPDEKSYCTSTLVQRQR